MVLVCYLHLVVSIDKLDLVIHPFRSGDVFKHGT